MKVSVISATYNRAHLLEELLAQWKQVDECTRYEYELIFSDDGSKDNTVQFLRSYKGLPLVVLENEHGGAAKARNSAVEEAKGELIIFTGDDIFPEPDFINKHYEYYQKNGSKTATLGRIEWRKNLDITYLMTHITEVGCEQFGFVGLPAYSKVDFRHFYTSNISVAKAELAQLDKVFDLTFDKYGFEDIELGYRLYKNEVEIFYAPDVLVYHDHPYHSIKKFCKRQQDAGEELAVFKKLHPELTEAEIKMDLDGFRDCYEKEKRRQSRLLGSAIWLLLQICIMLGSVLDSVISSYPYSFLKKACSKLYQFIFRMYMFAGLARGFGGAPNRSALRELAFAFRYLYFGYAQLFFLQGDNYCEEASLKVVTAGRKKIELVFDLQGKSYVDFRLDPLNFECKVRNLVVQAIPLQGTPILLTELSEKYNFSHTQDPSIEFTLPATKIAKLSIAYQLEYAHWQRGVRFLKRCMKWLRDKSKAVWEKKNIHNRLSTQPEALRGKTAGNDKVYITVRCAQPELLQRYQNSCAVLAPNVIVSDVPYESVTNYRQYIYEPTTLEAALDEMQFLNASLCLLYQELDFVIVSNSLQEYPTVGAASLADSVIYASKFKSVIDLAQGRQDVQGRILRLEGKRHSSQELDLTKEFPHIVWEQGGQLRRGNEPLKPKAYPKAHETGKKEKKKPLVFILPVFMAVGGVERNTIEVMREMKAQYDFVVITYEKHTMQVGNLFSQLYGLCEAFYDFHEIMTLEQYLSGLEYLKMVYQPDIIWLPNSNPWSLDQLPEIRKIFIDTPMVAQDVYDTEVGWIAHYDRPCTKAYDRYIAINSKIRDKFIQVYGLAQDKIDLIYSAVNVEKLKRLNNDQTFSREQVLAKYGLAADKQYFAFIGRVTEQKQPLAFVELAKRVMEKYADVRFVMVGSGNLNEAVETKIAEYGLEGKVHRIQFIENLYEFTKSLHGLVITSKYEGLPIVSIEAMGVGTPILSTDVGDMRLFVEKYKLGVIAATSKTSDLEQAFDAFYSQLDQYKANAEQGINENLHFFSSEFAAEQMDRVFKRSMEPYGKMEKIVDMETKKEPLVSVIIPSYNHEAYIRQAVESVLSQSYSNLELIVIDDGSTDGSTEILANIADVRYTFLAQENQGAHNAINRGLALAKGTYLTILNSDDVFAAERLKKCVQYMEDNPEALLVCSYIEIIDAAGNTKGIKEGWRNMEPWPIVDKNKSYAASDDFTKNLLLANFISTTSNMFFRRDVFEKIGGMRNLRYAHDWDFALRVAAMGSCGMLEEPLMKYRLHGSNTISKGRKHMLFEICWIYATHLPVFYPLVLAGPNLETEVELLLNSLNLQGNDKLLWVLFSLQASLKAQGVAAPELTLLDDAKLRERLMAYIVE